MSASRIAVMASVFVFVGAGAAFAGADTEPVIVVPGRPGVPVMIDGQDVSGAVIEGEWGLARGHTGITIIPPRPFYPWRSAIGRVPVNSPVGGYFPGNGRPPPVGRLEVIPPANRALPPPAENFRRVWETQSVPLPATSNPPYEMLPYMIGPLRDGGRHGPRPP
jgi:hypothetical protein